MYARLLNKKQNEKLLDVQGHHIILLDGAGMRVGMCVSVCVDENERLVDASKTIVSENSFNAN